MFNDLEQYSRRDCSEIRGIRKLSGVAREDTNEIVVELGRKIGVDLNKEDISTSHRLPNKVKPNGDRALFPPAIRQVQKSDRINSDRQFGLDQLGSTRIVPNHEKI